MNSKRRILAAAVALSLVAAACGGGDEGATDPDDRAPTGTGASVAGTLVGAGASSQAAAMQGWQVGFQAQNPNSTIEYDPIGSGGGREQFLSGGATFAGSDASLKDDEFEASKERCAGDAGAINLPHYVSPIAIPFSLDGVDSLDLSPDVIAGIFANTIDNWNDPAIAELNPETEFPDLAINPVHRSDESGTTENFTDYLSQAAPEVWTFGAIERWDDDDGPGGGEGGQGTSGVVSVVGVGSGSIGYADASQIGDLPAVAVGVAGEFVEFSPEAAGRVIDASTRLDERNEFDFGIEVNRTPDDAAVYPIALVSYHIVCLEYETQAEVDLVTAFMTYVGSEAGQAASAGSAGAAPISAEVRAEIATSIDQIAVGS